MAEVQQAPHQEQQPDGFFSSTAGTYFADKEALQEHYRSDFHRYNLKRKVAGLPPVTREWFDARKEQLNLAAGGNASKVWYDPLTRKKFSSEAKYREATGSKKYQELVRRSGAPAPEPIVTLRKTAAAGAEQPSQSAVTTTAQQPLPAPGYVVKPVLQTGVLRLDHNGLPAAGQGEQADAALADGDTDDEGSDWESASDAEDEQEGADEAQPMATAEAGTDAAEQWEAWDVRRSLFDNHVSASFEANMEYMYKHFGFYFPDAECLVDPEGLLKYLGVKLQYGHVPVGARGDDEGGRRLSSLHAVQRHMVDTNQCKLAWEDNEEEYEDFYDWGDDAAADSPAGKELVMADGDAPSSSAAQPLSSTGELALPGSGTVTSSGRRVLGSREFALFYRQQHRAADPRRSVAINTVLAKCVNTPRLLCAPHPDCAKMFTQQVDPLPQTYRSLGIATVDNRPDAPQKRAQKAERKFQRQRLRAQAGGVENNARRQAQGDGPFQR